MSARYAQVASSRLIFLATTFRSREVWEDRDRTWAGVQVRMLVVGRKAEARRPLAVSLGHRG